MDAPRTVVIGNITRDTLFEVDHLPVLDDVSTVRRKTVCFGGRGAASSTILSGTFPTELVTSVPSHARSEVESFLVAASDSCAGIEWIDTGEQLSEVLVTIGREEQDCTSLFDPGYEGQSVSKSQTEIIGRATHVYLTTHGSRFNIESLGSVRDNATVVCNITSYLFKRDDYRMAMLPRANVLIGNELEWSDLLSLLGTDHPREVFALAPRLSSAFRTLGARGAEAFTSSDSHFAAAEPGAVVRSPVGVGDAFASGALSALVRGLGVADGLAHGMSLARMSLASDGTCLNPADARQYFVETHS